MGKVLEFKPRPRESTGTEEKTVTCAHCAERHPRIRLRDGSSDFPTAFASDGAWFCRNSGCRAAWTRGRS